jgi:hypothetical protein
MYHTRGVVKTLDKRMVPGLKFKWSDSTATEFNEVILRLFNDQQFSYIATRQQKEKSIVKNTFNTSQYGTWEIIEDTDAGTLVQTTPTRFMDAPHEPVIVLQFLVVPSIKKPKIATRNDGPELKYISRDSREESERLPLMVVRDILTPRPTRPMLGVVSGSPTLLIQSCASRGHTFDYTAVQRVAYVGAIDSSFLNQNPAPQDVHDTDPTIMPIPSIKQMIIFHDKTYLLTEDGTIYEKNTKLPTPGGLPISFMHFKNYESRPHHWQAHSYLRHEDMFLITRDGSLFAKGYNTNGKFGLGDTNSQKNFVQVPLPEDEQAMKIHSSKTHAVLLLYNTTTATTVVRTAGSSNHGGLGVGYDMSLGFTAIDNKHFNNLWIKDVQCGTDFTFFLSDSGVLFACGVNNQGQCGTVSSEDIKFPRRVYDGVKQVQCRGKNTMILTESGRVFISGPAYSMNHCSFYRLPIPEYFRLANICLGKHYFLFTTDMHEVFALRDTKAEGIDAQSFVRAHQLSEKQTLLIQNPCIEALVQQNAKSLQLQMKIYSSGYETIAYFTKPDGKIKNMFSILWKIFKSSSFADVEILTNY